MTYINSWDWDGQTFLLLKPAYDGEFWPNWPANLNINGLVAPYGEQTSWNYNTNKYGWNGYLACGNQNWFEGEGGWTYDSLQVDECDDSFVLSKLQKATLDELDMLFTYTAEIDLDEDYGICSNCNISMKWNSIFQPAYMNMTSGTNNMRGTCTT